MRDDPEIKITKEDLEPLVYFIMSMFQQENGHMQGTSNKSDILGGYIDRWINKIPENLIFNNFLLKDKDYRAIVDYFIYGPESNKNAPDILGLKCINTIFPQDTVIKFAEFNETTWEMCDGMPHIEVKTFKKNQKLVAVREAQMDDDTYYVFVESDIAPDYLTSLFSVEAINSGLLNEIKMDETFIKSNTRNILIQPVEVKKVPGSQIGTLKLLSIIKGSDYKKHSVLCNEKEAAYYLKDVEEVEKIPARRKDQEEFNCTLDEYLLKTNNKLDNHKLILFNVDNPKNIIIKKVNKSSIYVECIEDCQMYTYKLDKDNIYKLKIELFERSSKWKEYITYKNQFVNNKDIDKTNDLICKFDNIYNKFIKVRSENQNRKLTETFNMINEIINKN